MDFPVVEDEVGNYLFNAEQIKCRCGCGYRVDYAPLLVKLGTAQLNAGFSFNINSWCRCYNHNRDVGGSETSSHRKGYAVDIETKNNWYRYKILHALFQAGFKRIGIGKNYIHADVDPNKGEMIIWLY